MAFGGPQAHGALSGSPHPSFRLPCTARAQHPGGPNMPVRRFRLHAQQAPATPKPRRVTHRRRRAFVRKPKVGKAISSPRQAGWRVGLRERSWVVSRECRSAETGNPQARHLSLEWRFAEQSDLRRQEPKARQKRPNGRVSEKNTSFAVTVGDGKVKSRTKFEIRHGKV
jgi:hypothetical protein